jgi:hypothetical protein
MLAPGGQLPKGYTLPGYLARQKSMRTWGDDGASLLSNVNPKKICVVSWAAFRTAEP